MLINSGLINEVTRILVTNGKALPYGLDSENSSKEMIARFNPGGNFEWEENMNKIHISNLRGLGRLLARIVLQNILPIYMNNGVTLDISKMIFAIMKRDQFCLCTPMVMTMIKLWRTHHKDPSTQVSKHSSK